MTIWATTIRLMPDFKTIADFRKNSGTAIRETVQSNQYRAICVDAVSFVPVPVEVNEIPVLSDCKQRVEATTGRSLERPVAMRHVAWRSLQALRIRWKFCALCWIACSAGCPRLRDCSGSR
jgi:hypothetical protein